MPNIAKMALKFVADLEQAQKDFTTMSATIANIENSAKTATPSMRNLTDAVKGLGMMEGAVQKAVEVQDIDTITHAKNACEALKSTAQRMGEGVADDILKMKPTISNVQKAQGEIQKLIALQKEMGNNGYLLDDAIKNAQRSMAELGNQASQVNMEMQMIKSVVMGINTLPFRVLSSVFAEILKNTKGWGETFNTSTVRAVAVTGALVIALGLAGAKMTALGVSTSYFVGLWKSSIIYQGLAGVITLLNTILGTQIAINAATLAWVGIATLGIGLLVAAVASLVTSWYDHSAAMDESKRSMEAIEESTNKVIDRWKELNNVAKNALEALMTPAEKLVNKLKEIDLSQNTDEIRAQMKSIHERQQKLAGWIADKKNHGWFAETDIMKDLKAEFKQNQAQFDKLYKTLKEMTVLTEEQLAAAKANAKIEYLKERYGKLIDKSVTVQEQYIATLNNLTEDLKRQDGAEIDFEQAALIRKNLQAQLREQLGFTETPAQRLKEQLDVLKFALDESVISQAEYTDKVREAMEKYDPGTKAAAELAKETQKLADKFRSAGKTPLESFKELSVDLRQVQEVLSPAEFATATNKLLSDLASGLGVTKFLADAATPARQLAETYRNLEAYARESGLADQELIAAKNRAREALEKQSAYYTLYQKAQDALLTTQEKLNRELHRIAEEAKQWGWDESIVAKMKELKIEDLLGKEQAKILEEARKSNTHLNNIETSMSGQRNPPLERGTVAYYQKLTGETKNVEKEAKQANKYLANIQSGIQRINTRMQFTAIMM